jgi:hypothetical protein
LPAPLAAATGVDLHRDQDLVVMGHLGAPPDQLQVGVDHRRPAQRDRRVARVVEPARELVALSRRGALDPLDPTDRRSGGAREHKPPAGEAALLRLGVEQGERRDSAGERQRQPAAPALRQRTQPPLAVLDRDDRYAAQRGRRRRLGVDDGCARARTASHPTKRSR